MVRNRRIVYLYEIFLVKCGGRRDVPLELISSSTRVCQKQKTSTVSIILKKSVSADAMIIRLEFSLYTSFHVSATQSFSRCIASYFREKTSAVCVSYKRCVYDYLVFFAFFPLSDVFWFPSAIKRVET